MAGSLHAEGEAGLPPLRDLLFLDDAMWEHDGTDDSAACASALGAGAAASAAGASAAMHSFAPAGADVYASRLVAPGDGCSVAHPSMTAHPLWSTLVDVYFACIKVRNARGARRVRACGCAARARVSHLTSCDAGDCRGQRRNPRHECGAP